MSLFKNLIFLAGSFILIMSCNDSSTGQKSTNKNAKLKDERAPKIEIKTKETKSKSGVVDTKDGIQWMGLGDLESALKNEGKEVIVDVYTKWCGPCKMMDKFTFTDEKVIKMISEKYHAVKFDAETPDVIHFMGREYSNPNYNPNRRGRNAPHQLSRFFQVPGYPSMVILDKDLNIKSKIVGYKTPDQFIQELEKI